MEKNEKNVTNEQMETEKAPAPKKEKQKFPFTVTDIAIALLSSLCVAASMHIFIVPNGFAPGGINGIATMAAHLGWLGLSTSVWILILNLPVCLLVFFKVKKSSGSIITLYLVGLVLFMVLLDLVDKEKQLQYVTENVVLPAIAGGVVLGFGFAMMIRRFGIVSGTFAISTLLKKKRPTLNTVWITFSLDCVVVACSFFVYRSDSGLNLDPVLCTMINLFIANQLIDMVLQGLKSAYKYEIFTDEPDALAQELMEKLGHGVSLVPAIGMYSHEPRNLLICVVRRRQMAEFHKIIKSHPNTFTYITNVREVYGYFK